ALLSWGVLGEDPGGTWLGMGVTIIGVAWVILERGRDSESPGLYPGRVAVAVFCGIGAAVAQAIGSVSSKLGMQGAAFAGLPAVDRVSELEASGVRLLVAFATGLLLQAPRLRLWLGEVRSSWRRIALASFVGTYLGIWMSLTSYRNAPLATATTLTSLTPIFVIPLVRIFFGTRISFGALAGALVALAGVVLLLGTGTSR
ncbi:MAG: EamA family transporter, partial [Planctomycetes bacterium]|nr:EamA family transporter [Planctomycetota bacterium]